jgi:hypothetical protein
MKVFKDCKSKCRFWIDHCSWKEFGSHELRDPIWSTWTATEPKFCRMNAICMSNTKWNGIFSTRAWFSVSNMAKLNSTIIQELCMFVFYPDPFGNIPNKGPMEWIIEMVLNVALVTGCRILETTIIMALNKSLPIAACTGVMLMGIPISSK